MFSLKKKIILWFILVNFVVTMICIVMMQISANSFQEHLIEENLENSAEMAIISLASDQNISPPDVGDQHAQEDQILLFDSNGYQIGGTAPLEVVETMLTDQKMQSIVIDDSRYYLYDQLETINDDEVWVRAYVSFNSMAVFDHSIYWAGIIVIPIILIGAVFGSIFITKMIFQPIAELYHNAREIAESGDMTKRIDYQARPEDEITMLSGMMNTMFDRLQASFESEKQFTADASHELRTPMAVILSQAEYLEEQLKDGEENKSKRKAVQIMLEKIRYMNRLLNSLLLIARIENNEKSFAMESLDFSELCAIVIEEMREKAQVRNIVLTAEIEENILIKADQAMIFRILINLLDNAVKYGRENGQIVVRLTKSDKNWVSCSVIDDGIGIEAEDLPKIWQRFYQVGGKSGEDDPSVGLGLFMVKKMIELHKGTITAVSEPGKGTEFTFTLPKNR